MKAPKPRASEHARRLMLEIARVIAKEEREACAKIVEDCDFGDDVPYAVRDAIAAAIAAAIRARNP